jgi:asparagine synthase (glutamine-hydrolysing)
MCGIGGVLFAPDDDDDGPRRGRAPPRWTVRMRTALGHRGPDGDGCFVDDGVALVHTRLALVDPVGGAQPIVSDAGVLVANGEIYNHRALRAALVAEGIPCATASDCAVLHAWLVRHGEGGLDRVEGEYAFCFWDRRRRRAVLGRDPLGVKPLVIGQLGRALWFASEARALLSSWPGPRRFDDDVVAATILCPPLSGDDVPFVGLHSAPPGAVIVVDDDGRRVRTHVPRRFRFAGHGQGEDPAVVAPALHDALAAAVDDRLVADATVGAFLSGGLDSAAIVARARRTAPRLPCVSLRLEHHRKVGLDDADRGGLAAGAAAAVTRPGTTPGSIVVDDDAPWTARLADAWGLTLHEAWATRAALVEDLDALCRTQDRLVAWEQELSQRALARTAAQHMKAVLVGDAADETHAGYAFALVADVARSPGAFVDRFAGAHRTALLKDGAGARTRLLDRLGALADEDGVRFDGTVEGGRRATSALIVARWLPRLLHNGDRHTMAFSLEARVPFADRRVLEVARRVTVADAFVAGPAVVEKAVLRRAVEPWLPPEVATRKKSALPRDDGLGPVWQRLLGARLVGAGDEGARNVDRLARWLEPDALLRLVDPASTDARDDGLRQVVFTALTLLGCVTALEDVLPA